ncbi:protein of unknown function [Bacillus sp. cl95]|uniref:DUF4269 domain-containing protein n=1 Tax=Bacillus sp. UNCCL13 TaxID=1502772 RepID=UPI0008E96F47|nr:DUF4269 domain-containing protein [Bacillus sp. UNCCL13]SFA85424.1 protein of unknown function [Bacillus sp. UNCCL13]SFQ83410.1 protein of unknown function [Bacillus sp. cl95]
MREESEIDFEYIDYLAQGNSRQVEVYQLLIKMNVMEILRDFDPILVGTIPIDIDILESDIDIICEVHDFKGFKKLVESHFHLASDFKILSEMVNGIQSITINFKIDDWPIEIFAQAIPTIHQNGYKHMKIEHQILNLLDEDEKKYIRHLRANGLKTEPAFATFLEIEGDPYQELLKMYDWDDVRLREFLSIRIANKK